jgi:hypothetical protein
MSLVSFGQPDNGIIQTAYVVEDMKTAIQHWTRNLKVGPWFLIDRFTGVDPHYRGQPSTAAVALAMSFAGHMNVELIQPLDDAPSVYRDTIQKQGYGFHHWGMATANFDADFENYERQGYEAAFTLQVPSGGRVAYMDTTRDLPGMIELIELGSDFEPTFNRFYRASIGWDGTDPIRPFL